MIHRAQGLLPLLLALGIASGSFWLLRQSQAPEQKAQTRQDGIDFWAENFTVNRHDPDGRLQHILSAQRMTHESSDDSSQLSKPVITWVDAPKLVVSADSGFATSKAETVDLVGNVKLDREPAVRGKAGKSVKGASSRASNTPLHVRTEKMRVHPDLETAEGRVPVRIEQGPNVVTGGSYRVNAKTGVSIIEGRVRASIPPRKDS